MVAEPAAPEPSLGLHAARLLAGTVAVTGNLTLAAARTTVRTVSRLPRPAALDAGIRTLTERGDAALDAVADAARTLLRSVIREVLVAFLSEADLTRIVRENVDLDEVARGIDVDAVVERADLERIVDRLDLDAIVATVDLDRAVARVDLDDAVRRVDIDAIAARLDIDAVIDRIDLVGLADQVIEGVDLPEIIRESTGSLSEEAVRGVRSQGMHADDAVAGFVGRLFGRDHTSNGAAPDGTALNRSDEAGDR